MASVKGTNFTNITADPIVKIDSGEWSGKMRVQYDTYEASSLASGSDISIARLPKGAKVYEIEGQLFFSSANSFVRLVAISLI